MRAYIIEAVGHNGWGLIKKYQIFDEYQNDNIVLGICDGFEGAINILDKTIPNWRCLFDKVFVNSPDEMKQDLAEHYTEGDFYIELRNDSKDKHVTIRNDDDVFHVRGVIVWGHELNSPEPSFEARNDNNNND